MPSLSSDKQHQAEGGILYHGAKDVPTKSRLPNILRGLSYNIGRDKTLAKISYRY